MRRPQFLAGMCVVATVLGIVATAGAGGVAQAMAQPYSRSAEQDGAGLTGSAERSAKVTGAVRFIVRRDPAVSAGRFAAALRTSGAVLVEQQPALGLAVVSTASGDAAAADALRRVPGVRSVARDYTVHPQALGFDPDTQTGSMTTVTAWTAAQRMWEAGYTGAGVDVAVLDTGVATIPALKDKDKVVVGPDLSFESQTPATRHLDSYGHGTVMAGIIAGREGKKDTGKKYAADKKNFYGMAPDARIVSVKMADRSGAVDVSQMIAGINWVVANRKKVGNIRVLNISYGARSLLNAQDDPLSWAAEAAWRAGIVVVASAGNDGQTNVGLASPAFNPWVIAVGATDTRDTYTAADDGVASFSNVGNGITRGPDIMAPGIGIIGPSVPGSTIELSYPKAKIGTGYIRGSGTSQAAAVVSGAAALTLQKFPTLTPDEVKRFLARTTRSIPNVPTAMQGKGTVDLNKVLGQDPDLGVTFGWAIGNGRGSLDAARGGNYVTINGTPLTGEVDIMGRPWDSAAMAEAIANGTAWDSNGNFNGTAWTGTGLVADKESWAGKTWQGKTWQGKTWQSSNWVGKTWQTGTWNGNTRNSANWSGPVAVSPWASAMWSSARWG